MSTISSLILKKASQLSDKSGFAGECVSNSWGKPFWTKVENGKAVLLGVTVVTVTPLSPPRISFGYSRKRPKVAIPLFLNLLMTFQQREAKLPSLKSVREFRKKSLRENTPKRIPTVT